MASRFLVYAAHYSANCWRRPCRGEEKSKFCFRLLKFGKPLRCPAGQVSKQFERMIQELRGQLETGDEIYNSLPVGGI